MTLRELGPDEVEIEQVQSEADTGEPVLTITVRGDIVLDEEAAEAINVAIAREGTLANLRATSTSHAVHVKPKFVTDTLVTYDPDRATGEPAGFDIVPAKKLTHFDLEANTMSVEDVPEVRNPYWSFEEQRQVNRPIHCPDSQHELIGEVGPVGSFLRCPRALVSSDVQPCHAGCVIACGVVRS